MKMKFKVIQVGARDRFIPTKEEREEIVEILI